MRAVNADAGTPPKETPSSRKSIIAVEPTKSASVSTCVDSMSGQTNSDSRSAMLAGCSAIHCMSGSNDTRKSINSRSCGRPRWSSSSGR